MPAVPAGPPGPISSATSSVKKDIAIAASDSTRSDAPISAEVSRTPGAPGALRQAGAGRSLSAGDKLLRPDWGTGQANFPQFDPHLQAPSSTLDTAPLQKPLQDLSYLTQHPTVAVEIPLTPLVAETAASSMTSPRKSVFPLILRNSDPGSAMPAGTTRWGRKCFGWFPSSSRWQN